MTQTSFYLGIRQTLMSVTNEDDIKNETNPSLSTGSLLNNEFVETFVHEDDELNLDVTLNRGKWSCKECNVEIAIHPDKGNFAIKRHLETSKHKANIIKNKIIRMDVDEIHRRFLKMMLRCNIPLYKVEENEFKLFFLECFNLKLKSRTMYRTELMNTLYEEEIKSKKKTIGDNKFYIQLDETPDKTGRKIMNIFVGILSERNYEPPFLLNTLELETFDAESVAEIVEFEVFKLISKPKEKKNFVLFITDGAAYCIKTGKILKESFKGLKHVVCIAHNMHNLSETIQKSAPKVNKLIVYAKRHYNFQRKLKKNFKMKYKVSFPSFPVQTRWGTWLLFASFLFNNYQTIKEHISTTKKSAHSDKILSLMSNHTLLEEFEIVSCYFFLTGMIKKVETNGLTVTEVVSIIKNLENNLKHDYVKKRWKEIKEKNPDLKYFLSYNVLTCTLTERFYNYSPLTTVQVERSFSNLKYVLNERRTNMSIQTLRSSLFFLNK